MATSVVDEHPRIESLSSPQVTTLLRTLRQHRELLDVAHEDVRRLTLYQRRPAYLVDFELIYRFMFRTAERPEWGQELLYLFDLPDTTLLIGPGTLLEIERMVYNAGFAKDSAGRLQDMLALLGRERPGEDEITEGMKRLNSLLESPNVKRYDDVVAHATVDEEALKTANAALAARRPHASEGANIADAINWAAVIHMRHMTEALNLDFHPYLLTGTRPLLDESSWSDEVTAPVSRRPTEAIYTEILLGYFPEPVQAQNHTIDMAASVAQLEAELRRSPAYRSPREFVHEPNWDMAVRERRLSDVLQEQLKDLTTFVTDPIVVEAQRVYDIAQLGTVSFNLQRGSHVERAGEFTQRLFDLIVIIDAALRADQGGSGIASLWSTALRIEAVESSGHFTHHLTDLQSKPRPYLTVEEYRAGEDPASAHYSIRWPTAANSEQILLLFSRAYARHAVCQVQLAVGTDAGIAYFGATLPLSLEEIVDAVRATSDTEPTPSEIVWIRMSADAFDLYADLLPPEDSKLGPVVGLFVSSLDPSHIVDLYARTSARYIFDDWLRSALEHIADHEGEERENLAT